MLITIINCFCSQSRHHYYNIILIFFSHIGGPPLSMRSICEMCCSSIFHQETQPFKIKCYFLVGHCCFFRDFCKSEGKLSKSHIILASDWLAEFLQSASISTGAH